MMSLLYGAYSPLYIDFYRGCVKTSENGIFVTNNIYAIAYNFTARGGTSAGTHLFDSTCSNISSSYSGECPLDDFASPIVPFDIP